MTRWYWKRWAWGLVAGSAVAAGSGLLAQTGKPGAGGVEPPKAGDTITLQFPGKPERKVTVVKATKKPDGTVETEVKDPKTGETFTLIDGPTPDGGKPDTSPAPAKTGKAEPPPLPAKTGKTDLPPLPAIPAAPTKTAEKIPSPVPDAGKGKAATEPTDAGKDRRLFGGKADKPAEKPAEKAVTTPAAPMTAAATPEPPAPPEKKPGLIGRILGRNKSNPPAVSATGTGGTAPAMPVPSGNPSVVKPGSSGPIPTNPTGAGDLPRVMPGKAGSVTPPSPVIPNQPPLPAGPLGSPPPLPVPMPSAPVPGGLPGLPAIPAVPGGGPTSFVPPGGGPVQVVLPVGYVPFEIALERDIQPHVAALNSALAPSARMMAAKALADGRHGSTDQVKGILFRAAQADPAPTVRGFCIEQLCKLGYYRQEFTDYLKACLDDPSEDVRDAAKAALVKMTPKR